ncbi:MAG: hypothetical protein M5U08_19985 [Burkholderiales bacterium]|nr:hypothetical protein [Burkholderiales bacterium]
MDELDPAGACHHHAEQVRHAARAGRAEGRPRRVRSGPREELPQRPGGMIRPHRDRVLELRHLRDRREVGHRVVRHVLEHARHEDHRRDRGEQEPAAVGCRARQRLAGDPPRGTRPVVDDDRPADGFLQPVGQEARDDVRGAAGRERDEDPDRMSDGVLRRGGQRRRQQQA